MYKSPNTLYINPPENNPNNPLQYDKNIVMDRYYEEVYNHFEKIEEEKEKIRRKMSRGKVGGDEMSTYSSYTRQACNFVFPTIGNKISGEDRPRPGKFRIKEEEVDNLGKIDKEGKDDEGTIILKRSKEEIQAYVKAITEYINIFIEYLKDLHREDKSKKHTLQDDIENFFKKYKGSFTDFYSDSSNKKSKLFDAMYTSSPKFMQIIFNIFKSAGPVLVYSNYVATEGLQIFKVYLSFFGFVSYEDDKDIESSNLGKKNPKDGFRYIEFHGGVEKELREANKKVYNMPENKFGDLIKIIMISPAGTEGINLRNTRQVHVIEPYWNEVRIEQIIGRAIRICSHADIPIDERHVDVFRYKMVISSKKETTDERMESIARKKNNLLISFTEAVKEVAVDCQLFKSHNMMGTKYKCFKFNENSLLENPIGPAYSPKIEYDKKMDDGSNSKDSYRQKIKVMKIKAVKKIGDNTYSESNNYWYFKDTGIVYDFDSDYPIGKVDRDNEGNETKLDNETYVITTLIDIPEFKLYD